MSTPISIEEFGDIHTASALGCIDAVAMFLRADPNSVHARNKNADGCTPLFHAAWGGYIALAELLLEYGADVNEKDDSGETPIHGASGWGRSKMVSWLISKGAEVNVPSRGYTPLHWAAQNGTGVVAQILLDAGADPNALDHIGISPLDRARESNNLPVIRVLERWLARQERHLTRRSSGTPQKRGAP